MHHLLQKHKDSSWLFWNICRLGNKHFIVIKSFLKFTLSEYSSVRRSPVRANLKGNEKAIQHLEQAEKSTTMRDDADVFGESWAILLGNYLRQQI